MEQNHFGVKPFEAKPEQKDFGAEPFEAELFGIEPGQTNLERKNCWQILRFFDRLHAKNLHTQKLQNQNLHGPKFLKKVEKRILSKWYLSLKKFWTKEFQKKICGNDIWA